MPRFFWNLLNRISDREYVEDGVLQAFQQAMELEGCLRLLVPDPLAKDGLRTWRSNLVAVDPKSVLIDTPADGRDRWQPDIGEVLEVAVLTRRGRQCGMAECIDRSPIPSGGSKTMQGWRFAYPPSLTVNERRRAHRVQVGFDLAPHACIIDGRSSGPMEANVMDLSIGGLQLRCDPAPGRLSTGQVVDLELHLPEPVGSVLVPVRVAAVRTDEQDQYWRVGMAFNGVVEGMAELVRSIEIRRARRRRAEAVER